MDPVTHALTGITIKQLGFKKKHVLFVLLLSSIAPDFDYVTRFWGADVFLRYHRGLTHGILALIVVPIILGLIFGYKKGFFYYFALSFLGYGAHLLMDLATQYGTRILSPLDWEQYSLDLVFIIDPYILLGLLACIIFGRVNKKKASLIAATTLILLVSYFGLRYHLHNKTRDFLKTKLDANTYKMCPLPNAHLRWWFVARSGNEILTGFADLFAQRISIDERYISNPDDPHIQRSKETRVVNNFLYFAKYPYADVKKQDDKTVVTWRELAFSFRAGEHFAAKVVFDKNDNIIESGFRF